MIRLKNWVLSHSGSKTDWMQDIPAPQNVEDVGRISSCLSHDVGHQCVDQLEDPSPNDVADPGLAFFRVVLDDVHAHN